VLAVMRSQEFQDAIAQLPGYAPKDLGLIRTIRDMFQSAG
jgi:hypothetical protein